MKAVLLSLFASISLSFGGCTWKSNKENVEVKMISPTKIEVKNDSIFLDFGKVWFGNIELKVTKENRGKQIVLRFGETRTANGVDRNPPGTVRYLEMTTPALTSTYTPQLSEADQREVKEIKEGVLPFRYLELQGWKGALNPDNISATVLVSKFFERKGKVDFKDGKDAQDLNALMELGMHTMAATSFAGIFVDGDRERLPYESDAYINQLGWQFATGDINLPRATIERLLKRPSWPSEWMSHMIFLAWEDYQYSGDDSFIKQNYAKIKEFTLEEFIDQTGLVNTTQKELNKAFVARTKVDYLEDIVDWPRAERDGHEMLPYNTVVNAFVYSALLKMADLAKIVGNEKDHRHYVEKSEHLKKSIQERLISPNGVYIDGMGTTHSSAHSLFIPLAFGLVKEEHKSKTLEKIKQRINHYGGGFPCSVYAAQYLLEALFQSGEAKLAYDLILNKTDRGWLNMIKNYDATITQEAWDKKYKENIDWTHAWGTAFFNIIPTHLVGIKRISPGWLSWTVSPSKALSTPVIIRQSVLNGVIEVSIDPIKKEIRYNAPTENVFTSNNYLNTWRIIKL